MAHRRVQHGGRADLLERVRVGRELGVLGQQRPQLVLERVVVGVGDLRLALGSTASRSSVSRAASSSTALRPSSRPERYAQTVNRRFTVSLRSFELPLRV